MAFIPQEEEDSNEAGMNVLAGSDQPMQQPMEQEQTDQPEQISGGQSATIGGEQLGSQTTPQPQGTRKQRGSGMFTDIRKYIQANQPAGGRLGTAVAKGIQKRTQTPAQKLAEQSKRIRQNYQAQQVQIGQAQQQAQQAGQQAGQLVNQQDLQGQQQRLQSRIGALGNLQQGGYQQDITGAQQAFQAFAPQVQQAQQAQQQAQQAFQQQQQNVQDIQQQMEQFRQDSPYAAQSDEDFQRTVEGLRNNPQYQQYFDLQQSLQSGQAAQQAAQQEQQARQQALQGLLGQQTSAQSEVERFQDLQGKFERQQDLLSQMTDIEGQLGGQAQLDPSNVQQIRNFLSGDQTFDVGALNTLQAQVTAQDLAQQAMDLENKTNIRKQLLRDTFGDKYTRGMAGLDDIILARTGQIGKLQEASEQAALGLRKDITEAQQEQLGLREDIIGQAQDVRGQTKEQLRSQLGDIMGSLEQRAMTGESGRLGELYQAFQSPEGLSQQQLDMLGGEQRTYGLDLQDAFQQAIAGQELQAGDVATGTEKARIDALRQLLGEAPSDLQTVGADEFSTAERNVFENIKQQIRERKGEYQGASEQIKNQVTAGWGEIVKPIAGELAGFAQRGEMPSDAKLREMQSNNYWTHAGMGRHGWVLPIRDMKAMIGRMIPKYQQLDQDMGITGETLKAFGGEAAKDGLIKRNALKRLAKRG